MQHNGSFGRWLKQRRKALALTQHDLAQLVGCSEVNIRKIEADERRPSQEIAEALASHLNVAPHEHAAFIEYARGATRSGQQRTASSPGRAADVSSRRILQRPTNLKLQLTPLIGRSREVALLRGRITRGETRLLTLTGPGGIGKTRLAIETAAGVINEFTDGVFLVELEMLTDPALVATTIAQTLGLVESRNDSPQTTLLLHLQDKHMLLVLDNFEQVVVAAPLITELLSTCAWLSVLITSRTPLHVRGERQFAVPSLALPDPEQPVPLETLAQYGAIALFSACAQAVQADWALTERNAPDVVKLCTALDGLPLAIELAAVGSRVFAPSELLQQLSSHDTLLTRGFRDLPSRQQTLRDAIDWTYTLLDAPAQQLFARLSVFRGGCSLQAAVEVCGPTGPDAPGAAQHASSEVASQLLMLVDQSLLRHEVMPSGGSRFLMLNTIREYARVKLQDLGEERTIQDRHLQYFLSMAEHAETGLRGAQQQLWVERLECEHHNFQAALVWCRSASDGQHYGLRLAGALGEFWFIRSYLTEGRAWLQELLDRSVDAAPAVRARALGYAGTLASAQGDYAMALVWDQASLELYRSMGDIWGTAYAMAALGDVQVWHTPDTEAGCVLLEQSMELVRVVADPWLAARVGWRLGTYWYYSGRDTVQAQALLQECLAQSRVIGDVWGISNVLPHLGNMAWAQHHYERAIALAEEAITLAQLVGNRRGYAMALNVLGMVALAQGNYASATAYHEESLRLAQTVGLPFQAAAALVLLGQVALQQGSYQVAQTWFRHGLSKHRQLNDHHGIALCLAQLATVADGLGQRVEAVQLLGATAALLEQINARLDGPERRAYDQTLAATRAGSDPETWTRAWESGRTMSTECSMEAALGHTLGISRSLPMFAVNGFDDTTGQRVYQHDAPG